MAIPLNNLKYKPIDLTENISNKKNPKTLMNQLQLVGPVIQIKTVKRGLKRLYMHYFYCKREHE